jgi:L-lactate utilization protein LutC
MSARDNILQRLRAAPQGTPPLPPDVRAFHAAARAALPASTRASRCELFCEKMAFWHAEVVRVTASDWPEKLRRAVRGEERAFAALWRAHRTGGGLGWRRHQRTEALRPAGR